MSEMVEANFKSYKEGFMEARKTVIRNYRLGIEMHPKENLDDKRIDDLWYNYGYHDSLNYYCNMMKKGPLDMDDIRIIDYVKESFKKQLTNLNYEQSQQENVPHRMK